SCLTLAERVGDAKMPRPERVPIPIHAHAAGRLGEIMGITRITVIVSTILGAFTALGSASAAQKASTAQWVGSWEYVAAPLPPGETPPVAPLGAAPALTPLDAPGAVAGPARAVGFPPPRIDNPGNVPLDTSAADL